MNLSDISLMLRRSRVFETYPNISELDPSNTRKINLRNYSDRRYVTRELKMPKCDQEREKWFKIFFITTNKVSIDCLLDIKHLHR